MTIYEELIERVSNGETFHIDLEKRTLRVGKKFLIIKGKYDTSRTLFSGPSPDTMETILSVIDVFYWKYKYSLPSERSDKKRKTYFKALPIEEIPDKELLMADRREITKARLEGYILCMILEEKFVWDENTMGKWFYQSKKDKDLVILRTWIEN
jgi:hypothetical protein